MEANEEELGPIDVVVIGYPPGAPMTGDAIPLFLDRCQGAAFVSVARADRNDRQ